MCVTMISAHNVSFRLKYMCVIIFQIFFIIFLFDKFIMFMY